MNKAVYCSMLGAFAMLSGCASQPDRFYTLSVLPAGSRSSETTPTIHVLLQVDVPSLVDRAEMVINTSDTTVAVLDHERWASSVSDQATQTLARDIEQRRADVLVGDRGFARKSLSPVTIRVDLVRMSAQRGRVAGIEAHWHIVDDGTAVDEVGSGVFEAPVHGTDSGSIALAYSEALSALADKLAAAIRAR